MMLFTMLNKKKQAINLRQKSFKSSDTFKYQKQNGTSNKFPREIFSFMLYSLE